MDNWELTRNREMGSREIRILNYEFSFCLFFFCRCEYSFVQRQEFCLSGSIWLLYLRPQVIDLRLWRLLPFRQKHANELKASTAMGFCIRRYFWLEKPDFHNRRIHSAAWIVVRNLPGRQYFYSPRRRNDAKSASPSEYHNPCAAAALVPLS